jgi:hypothetical protein
MTPRCAATDEDQRRRGQAACAGQRRSGQRPAGRPLRRSSRDRRGHTRRPWCRRLRPVQSSRDLSRWRRDPVPGRPWGCQSRCSAGAAGAHRCQSAGQASERPWRRASRAQSGSRRPEAIPKLLVRHTAATGHFRTELPSRPKERPDDQPEQDWRPHQLSTPCAAADPLSEARSASPMNAAGAAAYPPGVRGPSPRAHQSRLGCTRRLVRQVDLETGPRCDTRAPVAETASQSSASSDSGRICPPSTTIV